ncbi:MAG TPA: GNAT family N-acetyltransferase [Solirubrobacteraceae bacterium]|jgi:ribosomal-protein-alanine N-acetyltransferase
MDGPLLTERLRMRPWETDDVAAVREMFADPEVGQFVGVAPTLEAAEKLVDANRRHQEAHGFATWAVQDRSTGALVGEIGLQLIENAGPEVEIGWTLAKPAWGRGYATEAAAKWLEAGFGQLALEEIIAVIRAENEASHRVARRLGMRRAGTRRAYGHELDLYTISRASFAGA